MHTLRTVTSLDVSAVAGHHAMPAALLFTVMILCKHLQMGRIVSVASSMYGFDLYFCFIDFMICFTDFIEDI